MLVIADTSPLVVLANIGEIHILHALYGTIIITPEVKDELQRPDRSSAARDLAASLPSWFELKSPAGILKIPRLDPGEISAISLALELKADLLLIDEAAGRRAAVQHGLRIVGTIGILKQAADADLLKLSDAFARIKRTDFWISHAFLDEFLRTQQAANRKQT